MSNLSPEHYAMLHDGSGISDDVMQARGYQSLSGGDGVRLLKDYGFNATQAKLQPGLLLPLHSTDGQQALMVYRPNSPRVNRDGKPVKYEIPRNTGIRVDCPPWCQPMLADPTVALWITEGQKKADALASVGACAIGLLGVWNFKGKNSLGGTTLLADLDCIAFDSRDVRIVFDSDVMTKPSVRQALDRLTVHLQRRKANVTAVYLPPVNNNKVGVDDYLAAEHTLADLEALVEAPRPQPKPAPDTVELLDTAPPRMSRPLSLIDGRAYAATWLHVKVTRTQDVDKNGNIIQLDPPLIENEQRLFVVRDDGRLFGNGGDESLDNLAIEVALPDIPPTEKLWGSPGLKDYRGGNRPSPVAVFTRLVEVIDRFIDFNRSLAPQHTMCELVACYILTSWFLDAFTVIGFLWPNGEKGSGKSQLLNVVAELAYLGQTILAGGSYASLRDLADYGATLAFDDAENVMDVKRGDPDKRTLLLAGNRKGNTIPVKEPTNGHGWRIRHVNTFCPRLFSAIRLPDSVLASRTIVVPLIRTPDRYRANADPLDYKMWPHERGKLVQDLWAVALHHLSELPEYESQVNDNATLTGRNLEPWRPILAVALWLEAYGCDGIADRIEQLSVAYQEERPDLEPADMTALVIRALCNCATRASNSTCATNTERFGGTEWTWTTAEIKKQVVALAKEDENVFKPENISTTQVGRVLGKMRLKKAPRPGGKGSRKWTVTIDDLKSWCVAYGMQPPNLFHSVTDDSKTSAYSGTSGISGSSGTSNYEEKEGTLASPEADEETF